MLNEGVAAQHGLAVGLNDEAVGVVVGRSEVAFRSEVRRDLAIAVQRGVEAAVGIVPDQREIRVGAGVEVLAVLGNASGDDAAVGKNGKAVGDVAAQ